MLAPREAYSVSSLAALREVGSLKSSMTKSQAETVLASLVAKGWLLKSKLSDPSYYILVLVPNIPQTRTLFALDARASRALTLPQVQLPRRVFGMHDLHGGTLLSWLRPCSVSHPSFLDRHAWRRLQYAQLQNENALSLF